LSVTRHCLRIEAGHKPSSVFDDH